MVHMLPLNIVEHFTLLSLLTEIRVNAISGAHMAFLSMVLVHFAPFSSLIHTPLYEHFEVDTVGCDMVVLLIRQ